MLQSFWYKVILISTYYFLQTTKGDYIVWNKECMKKSCFFNLRLEFLNESCTQEAWLPTVILNRMETGQASRLQSSWVLQESRHLRLFDFLPFWAAKVLLILSETIAVLPLASTRKKATLIWVSFFYLHAAVDKRAPHSSHIFSWKYYGPILRPR